jgi:hypothetical protein
MPLFKDSIIFSALRDFWYAFAQAWDNSVLGSVWNRFSRAVGAQMRGLGFAFFSLLLALLCWHTTGPETSFIGRSAGGLFVWALSIPDAYRIARIRYEVWRYGH